MNFKNLVLFDFLVILFISLINILGEQVSNYKEIEPGGKFGNNQKRKLADSNYITVKYGKNTEYTSFGSTFRTGISHIVNEGKIYSQNDSFTIQANNSIEVHFSSDVNTLYGFFEVTYDRNAVNIISIDLSRFDSSLVTEMGHMYYDCKQLQSINMSNFNTSLVTDMNRMFFGCSQIESINLSSFNTSSVITMNRIFTGCYQLESINLSSFNTSLITDMSFMFYNTGFKSLDLSSFNTSSVVNMYGMFSHCSQLKSINLSSFDTSSVIYMYFMFYDCNQLESLNLSNFNTSLVIDTNSMFKNCMQLKSLELSNFNTSSLETMDSMFYGCISLKSLDLSGFDLKKLESSIDLFVNVTSLKYINLNDTITSQSFLNEVNKTINKIDYLIVCQNSQIITNPSAIQTCCNYDIEIGYCDTYNYTSYIIVYYGKKTEYNSNFINEYRKNLKYIIYDNSKLGINGHFIIEPDSKIEIYFSSPIISLK